MKDISIAPRNSLLPRLSPTSSFQSSFSLPSHTEIGYHLHRDWQKRGYAREAARACRDWAFEHTPFNTLYSSMKADNAPSIGVARANGMQLVEEYTDDENERSVVYAVTRSEWTAEKGLY